MRYRLDERRNNLALSALANMKQQLGVSASQSKCVNKNCKNLVHANQYNHGECGECMRRAAANFEG